MKEGAPAPAAPPTPAGKLGLVVLLVVLAVPAYAVFTWFFCRIEVPAEHVAVLIAKTGESLKDEQVIARQAGTKGIQLEVLKPGRHFRNPLFWDWEILPYAEVTQGQVGVLTRLYGDTPDLSQDLLVPADTVDGHWKGIVREPLLAGQYPLNPYAYDLEHFPAFQIEAGFVGVVCNQVGREPAQRNTYLVGAGERGVQKEVLRQGSHYLNPYATVVYAVDVRSQRLELSGSSPEAGKVARAGKPKIARKAESALHFPSSDGFEIEVHLTVEWSIDASRAPDVFVRIGTGDPDTLLDEVLDKTLIPALRGNARIQGSKYPAANYISGESRTVFQDAIFNSLKAVCGKQGIIIRSVLVNDIVPPNDIAGPIRQREVAKEELTRNQIQEEQAKAEQSLARETVLVEQEKARVLAETQLQKDRIAAENRQRVALIEQDQLLAVAKADLAAAKLQSEAILARGRAEAAVIVANNMAEAKALEASVSAFRTPSDFASYTFAQRMAPSVRHVFASPEGPFGRLFRALLEGASAGEGDAR